MKKFWIYIILFICFIILFFAQTNFFNWFTIAGVMPNVFIILVLFIGLFAGKEVGFIMGVIFGTLLDFFFSKTIGISGIMLGIIGFLGGQFDKNFSKDSRMTMIFMVISSSLVYEIGYYLINMMIYKFDADILGFAKVLLIEVIYNSILIIIFYPIIQKFGYYIEDTFKSKNILTRYF